MISSLNNVKSSESFGLLLEGFPKTGKTVLALQFPKVWVANCDNNLPGALAHFRKGNHTTEVYYDNITFDEAGVLVPEELRWTRFITKLKAALASTDIKTVVLDNLSNMDLMLQYHIIHHKKEGEKGRMTIGDWVPYKDIMGRTLTMIRSYRKNAIVISHLTGEKDDVNGVMKYKPQMSSKLQDTVGGFFSDVWLTESDGVTFTARATQHSLYQGLGNSMGLPTTPFVFDWKTFNEKYFSKSPYVTNV